MTDVVSADDPAAAGPVAGEAGFSGGIASGWTYTAADPTAPARRDPVADGVRVRRAPASNAAPAGHAFRVDLPAMAQPADIFARLLSADELMPASVDAEQTSFEPAPRRTLLI